MHHRRPPRSPLAALRGALRSTTELLSPRRGALLAFAVALAVAAGTALFGQTAGPAVAGGTVAAAAERALPSDHPAGVGTAVSAAAESPGDDEEGGQQPEPTADEAAAVTNPNCTL